MRRADVAQRLADMVTVPASSMGQPVAGPRILNQGGLNLCGPAAFFQMALGRDPVAVVRFAIDLFNNRTAAMGELVVTPHPDLLKTDFDAMLARSLNAPFSPAEWMLFSALRNSTDVFWQPLWRGDPEQLLAGMTRPEELADWMTKSGVWSRVDDHGKWASNPGIPAATDLLMAEGIDIALLVNTNLIDKSDRSHPDNPRLLREPDDTFLLSAFPNHWVVLLNEIATDVAQENVLLTVWTWGYRLYLKTPKQVFLDNYYGAVLAET